jgi:transposase-like protein
MPLQVNEGKVVKVDGAYITIKVKINGKKIYIDRLINEVEPITKFSI